MSNKTIPVPLELEEIAEKAAGKIEKLLPGALFTTLGLDEVTRLILSALTEACQSRDVEIRMLRPNYDALRKLFDLNPTAAYAHLEKAEARIQRLKEALGKMPEIAYQSVFESDIPVEKLPNELQVIVDAALSEESKKTQKDER